MYGTSRLKQVSSFKYLGLVTNGHGLSSMVAARLTAASRSWGTLMGIMVSRGWRDRAMRLLLFDTYVKTCLLYGAAVWGS